jgi:hypothetical protein
VTQGLLDSLACGPIVSLGFTSKQALDAVPHQIELSICCFMNALSQISRVVIGFCVHLHSPCMAV